MTPQEYFEAALTAARAAFDAYHEAVLVLCMGTSIAPHDIEHKKRLAQEAENDFRVVQMNLLGLIANPLERQRQSRNMEIRATGVDKCLADLARATVIAQEHFNELQGSRTAQTAQKHLNELSRTPGAHSSSSPRYQKDLGG